MSNRERKVCWAIIWAAVFLSFADSACGDSECPAGTKMTMTGICSAPIKQSVGAKSSGNAGFDEPGNIDIFDKQDGGVPASVSRNTGGHDGSVSSDIDAGDDMPMHAETAGNTSNAGHGTIDVAGVGGSGGAAKPIAGVAAPMPSGPRCGDHHVDPGETCDGDCPDKCERVSACVDGVLKGSAATCDAKCVAMPITSAINGDGCCPTGVTSSTDNDCQAGFCGDGVIDPGELCDRNCPTDPARDCGAPNPCTYFKLVGMGCTLKCEPWDTATDGNINQTSWSYCQNWCMQNCRNTDLSADEKRLCATNGYPTVN